MADKYETGGLKRGRARVATPEPPSLDASPSPQVVTTPARRILVARRVDAWLVGGLGIAAWLALTALNILEVPVPALTGGPIYWLLLAISGTHFGASYHLAYGEGRERVRARWLPLIAVPAGLLALFVIIGAAKVVGADRFVDESMQLLLVAVFTLTSWHYIKQVYGVARLGASMAGFSLTTPEVRVLRYGLYPLWFLEASRVWSGRSGASFDGFEISYSVLPTAVANAARPVALLAGVAILVVLGSLWARTGRVPPATLWSPYVASFLWFLFPPSLASLVLAFAALHGLQYLACAHRAEMAWGVERGAQNKQWWWLSTFGGALATGMLLVYWLPQVLTDGTQASALGTIPAIMLFAGFNLHHYAVDATIWRFGGEHVRRIAKGPRLP